MRTTLQAAQSLRMAGLLAALAACVDGTGPCRVASLRVAMPATIDRGPRGPGNVVPANVGVFVGQWGPLAPPNGAPASAALHAENFNAWDGEGSVTGTIEVLAIGPLRLRLDALATNGTGEEIRVRGDMVAEALGNALGCD